MAQLPLPKANINTYFSWLRGGVGGQFPRNGVRVRVPGAKCELNLRSSPIAHVRYSKILTWLRGAPRLPGHFFFNLAWFSLCSSLLWELRDNRVVIPTEGPSFQFTLVCIFARIPPDSSDSSSTAGVHGEKAARTYKTSPQATCCLSRVGKQTSKLLPYQHTTGFLNKA